MVWSRFQTRKMSTSGFIGEKPVENRKLTEKLESMLKRKAIVDFLMKILGIIWLRPQLPVLPPKTGQNRKLAKTAESMPKRKAIVDFLMNLLGTIWFPPQFPVLSPKNWLKTVNLSKLSLISLTSFSGRIAGKRGFDNQSGILLPRAKREVKGVLSSLLPRAKREAEDILVNLPARAKRET